MIFSRFVGVKSHFLSSVLWIVLSFRDCVAIMLSAFIRLIVFDCHLESSIAIYPLRDSCCLQTCHKYLYTIYLSSNINEPYKKSIGKHTLTVPMIILFFYGHRK